MTFVPNVLGAVVKKWRVSGHSRAEPVMEGEAYRSRSSAEAGEEVPSLLARKDPSSPPLDASSHKKDPPKLTCDIHSHL